MSKSTRTGVWGLEARGRVRYRALLGSVGLHLLLLAGLAMLYSRHDPSSATSSAIIVVEFVLLEDGDGDGGRVQNADPVADEPELPNASDAAEGSLAQTEADGTATRALSIDSAERVAEVSEVSVVAEETTVEGAPHDSAGTPTLEPPQPLERAAATAARAAAAARATAAVRAHATVARSGPRRCRACTIARFRELQGTRDRRARDGRASNARR